MPELTPRLEEASGKPLYIQLYDYVRREIEEGRLTPGTRLPSKRKWSQYLGVSLNTVDQAYQQLIAEGYAQSRPRQGIYVADHPIEMLQAPVSSTPEPVAEAPRQNPGTIDFHYSRVDTDHFPFQQWRKWTTQVLKEGPRLFAEPADPQGDLGLRREITRYLYASRGVTCLPEQILIASGTQSLIRLICQLLEPTRPLAMEDPGFHRARDAFRSLMLPLVPISLDRDGIRLDELKRSEAGVVYVTPSHQFPLGAVMPFPRRIHLLSWAQETGGWILEDDYDSEFRYSGKPIPALKALDRKDRVLYLGTFSKSLLPDLRISYAVLPGILIDRFRNRDDWEKLTSSRLNQMTLRLFMEKGDWLRHLNRMRTLYRKKHRMMVDSLREQMGDRIQLLGQHAGLHLAVRVRTHLSEAELVQAAGKRDLLVYPLSPYFANPCDNSHPTILLGFGALSLESIRKGIPRLREAWFG